MMSMDSQPDLRMVLVGQTGAGKTALMTSILRSSEDRDENKATSESNIPLSSYTKTCGTEQGQIGDQNVVILDTPGLCQPVKSDEDVMEEIKKSLSMVSPGPHVFLFVQKVKAFGSSETNAVEIFMRTFKVQVLKHTMVLFTHVEEKENIEQLIQENPALKDFVSKCEFGHHVIDNNVQDAAQVNELLGKINNMVQKNKGKFYSLKEVDLRKDISLAVGGGTLAGAAAGGILSHFAVNPLGITGGVVGGATVGAVVGAGGILAFKHITAKMNR